MFVNKRRLLFLFFSLVLGIIAGGILFSLEQHKTADLYTKPTIGGTFTLQSATGLVTEDILKNKVSLIYFGFTYCPDICPTTLNIMAQAVNNLPPALQEHVQGVFVSVDPERDPPASTQHYAEAFHKNFIGLTGTAEQLEEVAAAYKVYFAKRAPENQLDPQNYLVDHSGFIFLTGKDGQYIQHFSHDTVAEEITQRIQNALEK